MQAEGVKEALQHVHAHDDAERHPFGGGREGGTEGGRDAKKLLILPRDFPLPPHGYPSLPPSLGR